MLSWKVYPLIAGVAGVLVMGAVWIGLRQNKGMDVSRTSYQVPQRQEAEMRGVTGDETVMIEGGMAKSENYMMISSPGSKK